MGRPHEVAELIKQRVPPSAVARRLNISISSILSYAKSAVGFGLLTRSDVVFSIELNIRKSADQVVAALGVASPYEISRRLAKQGITVDAGDIKAYIEFKDAAVADLYLLLRQIETSWPD